MSVIVKGMRMPTSCTMCWLNTVCGVWNEEPVKHKGFNERIEGCPLTELIRCKDCKHINLMRNIWRCTQPMVRMISEAEDYCSRAERREE